MCWVTFCLSKIRQHCCHYWGSLRRQRVCVEGIKGKRGGSGKELGNREESEGVLTFSLFYFPLLFQIKPAGTWNSSAACDWLTMWWNDGVRIPKGLLWLADVDAHTWRRHTKSCPLCTHKRTWGNAQINIKCTHLDLRACTYKHTNGDTHACTRRKTALNLELHACTHTSTQCLTKPAEKRDWNQTGERTEAFWHRLVY